MRIFKTTKLKTNGIKGYKPSQKYPGADHTLRGKLRNCSNCQSSWSNSQTLASSSASAPESVCTQSHLEGAMCDQVKSLTDIVCAFIKIRNVVKKKLKNERDE